MNCQRIEQRLSAWRDGQLDEPERSLVAEHLRICPRCAAEAEELAAVDRYYAEAEELHPQPAFADAVHARIAATIPSRSWLGWLRPAPQAAFAFAAAVTLAAVLSFWLTRAEARPAVVTCRIDGMMCEQCDRQVHRILQAVPGVETVQVDAKTGRARLQLKRGRALSLNALTQAVNQTRQYRVTDIEVTNEGETERRGGEIE